MVFKWAACNVYLETCRVSESVGESVEGIREIVSLLPVSRRCHVDCVTRDVT